MLTYNLVRPSFVILKLSSICGAVPFQADVHSGKLEPRISKGFKLALKILRGLAILKIIQLLHSIFRLSHSVEHSLRNAILVTIVGCLCTVAIIWSFEFEKHPVEVIVLFIPLREASESQDVYTKVIEKFLPKRIQKSRLLMRQIEKLVRTYIVIVSYFQGAFKDFVRHLPRFSVHDMLTLIVAPTIPFFLSVGYSGVIIGEPMDALTLSLLTPQYREIQVMRAAAVLFDLTAITFCAMTLHLGFFILCATLAVYAPQLKQLERFIDDDGIKSQRSLRYVWQEMRRMAIIFNMFNYVGSNCFYAGKIMAFTCSVLGSFYAFRFGVHDFVSGGIAMLAVAAITFYLLCLGNAYVITETMSSILWKIKFRSQFFVGVRRMELKQRVKSFRHLSLTEGGFRGMSRETTPEFVEFYVTQLIDLVIAF